MKESQQDPEPPTPEISAEAEAFADALVRADSSMSWTTALRRLSSLSQRDALAAIARRSSQLSIDEAEARQRLDLVRRALEQAEPLAPAVSLPPFEAYRRVAADELTPRQAGDLWRAHLADGSWEVEWINRVDAYIASRSRPGGESELVSFARAQVEAARAVGDPQLVAMALSTLGGVTIQIQQHVAEGLGIHLDALEALRGIDSAILDHYLYLICTNLSNLLHAVPKYDGAEAVPPLCRRVVEVVAPAATGSRVPAAAAAAYEALSCAIDEAAQAGADDVEELAERVAAVPWPELRVGTGVMGAALILAEHLPPRSLQPTLELAEGMADRLGDHQSLRKVRLQAGLLTVAKALRSDDQVPDDAARDEARAGADRLDGWLQKYTQDAPALEVGMALLSWAKARAAVEPDDPRVGDRLGRALEMLRGTEDSTAYYRHAMEQLGRWLGREPRPERARELFLPLRAKMSPDGHVDTAEVDARASGLYEYCLARRLSKGHDFQVVAREIIPLLEAASKGAWDQQLKIACGSLLLSVRMFANFKDAGESSDNLWGVVTMLTDIFPERPPNSDADTLPGYWNLQAQGWSFIARMSHSDDLKSLARDKRIQAAEMFERLGDTLRSALSWLQLAQEEAGEDPDRAAEFLERIRDEAEDMEGQFGFAGSYHNTRGQVAQERGDDGAALAEYARAAESFQHLPDEFGRYTAKLPLANRGRLLMKRERWQEAYQDLSSAIALEEQYLDRLPIIPQNSPMTPFESDGAGLSSFTQPVYSNMALTCLRLGRAEESFNWSERARASNLRRQIASRSSGRAIAPEPCDLVGVRQTLGEGREWVFIQYLVRDRETLAYVVTSESVDVVELSGANGAVGELTRLEVELDGRRSTLGDVSRNLIPARPDDDGRDRWDRALGEMGERIFDGLLAPLLEKLSLGSVRRLVLSGNGGLERLPWNLAVWREGGQQVHIIDRFTVRKAISASLMRLMASRRAERLAGIVVIGNHPDLPFVTLEASEVESVMRPWLGSATTLTDADPAALIAALAGRSHVHLACHGDFDDFNPLQTRLILNSADPGMTIRIADIASATLESGCAVVLSACETGMLHHDTGGEHLGLPAAFALAGASAVIGAAWPVDDLPTAMLMARFYSQWQQVPKDPSATLGPAQRWLRDRTSEQLAGDVDALLERHHDRPALGARLMRFRDELRRSVPTQRPFVSPRYWAGFEAFA
jgi:CHAT domain-containing protein/tetratricopeptide (TPR) repeat protein